MSVCVGGCWLSHGAPQLSGICSFRVMGTGDFVEKRGRIQGQEMAPKCTTKWKSMEPKADAHYKIQNWHHSKLGNMGLLQNRLEQIISLRGGVNVQKRLCMICYMICSIQFNLFCRGTFRNPCCIPGFFLPRFLSCHVLACPSTTVKALWPWDFHCLVVHPLQNRNLHWDMAG